MGQLHVHPPEGRKYPSLPFRRRWLRLQAWTPKSAYDIAGDGNICALVLIHEMYAGYWKAINSGSYPKDVENGLLKAIRAAHKILERLARPINTYEEIYGVIKTAVNGDLIGEIVYEAMGADQDEIITVEAGLYDVPVCDTFKILDAFIFGIGYMHPYFESTRRREMWDMDAPLILIHENILSAEDLSAVVNFASTRGRSLLLVVGGLRRLVGGLRRLVGSAFRHKVCITKTAVMGEDRRSILEDLAIVTGAHVLTKKFKTHSDQELDMCLGSCRKVLITMEETVIIGGFGEKCEIKARLQQLRSEIECSVLDIEKVELQNRLWDYTRRATVIQVIGGGEVGVLERKEKVADAINSVKAALAEGIVPGGGVALLHVSKKLEDLSTTNADKKIGVDIVRAALKTPFHTIVSNSGINIDLVVRELEAYDSSIGYDVMQGKFVDVFDAGIIDPYKILRLALFDAEKVCASAIILECLPRKEF